MEVVIHNLDCNYTVPRGAGTGEPVRSRLDQVAARLLTSAFSGQLPLPLDHGARYFFERLDVTFHVRSDLTDSQVARAWAAAIWNGLSEGLSRKDGVVVFRSRAEWLAAFLPDLAAGLAESVWYYARLLQPSGLLPGERAARVLTEDPDAGRDALIQLHRDGRLEDVLTVLNGEQLDRVVRLCLLPASPEVASGAALRRWKRALREVADSRRFVPSGLAPRDTLLLYLEVLRLNPELGPDVNLARFIARVLELRETARRVPEFRVLLARGEWTQIRPLLDSPAQARFVASVMQTLSPGDVAGLVERLEPAPDAGFEQQFLTGYAGVFLLASAARESGDWEKLGPLALYLAALQCLGAPQLQDTVRDRGISAFAGLAAPPSPDQLAGQLSEMHLPPAGAAPIRDPWFSLCGPGRLLDNFPEIDACLQPLSRAMVRHFLRRLGALSDCTPEYACRTLFQCRGVVTVSAARISVRYLTCPLRVVLRMAGFGSEPVPLPWARGKLLELDLD